MVFFLPHYFIYLAEIASNEREFHAAKLKGLSRETEVKCLRSWNCENESGSRRKGVSPSVYNRQGSRKLGAMLEEHI